VIDHQLIVKSILSATQEVFGVMLGLEIQPGEGFIEQQPPKEEEGLVALIGLAGPWIGTGMISCSAQLACTISSLMFMAPCPSVNEEVLDAMGEITNMIIGNVKTDLEEYIGPLGLSIPTVIFGRNFTTRGARHQQWSVIPFLAGQEKMIIKMCLTANKRTGMIARPGFAQPYALWT